MLPNLWWSLNSDGIQGCLRVSSAQSAKPLVWGETHGNEGEKSLCMSHWVQLCSGAMLGTNVFPAEPRWVGLLSAQATTDEELQKHHFLFEWCLLRANSSFSRSFLTRWKWSSSFRYQMGGQRCFSKYSWLSGEQTIPSKFNNILNQQSLRNWSIFLEDKNWECVIHHAKQWNAESEILCWFLGGGEPGFKLL